MGLKKLGRAIDKAHRGHRKIGLSLAKGDIKGVKDGVKQAHSGDRDALRAVATTAKQDTASLIRRHPELGLDPGLRAIANSNPNSVDPLGLATSAPAPSPGLQYLQKIIAAQQNAQGGSREG
ncbi:MAG: hypothetical protein U1E65_17930 [Myxococcota bacterium]